MATKRPAPSTEESRTVRPRLEESTQALVDEWLSLDPHEETRAEIQALVEKGDVEELQKRLGKRMAFGTAGLRGRIGAGFNCMNLVTVQQASQGLCACLEECDPSIREGGVMIGYDGRYKSRAFACITAAVFLSRDIPVWLASHVVPTPLVAFGVRHLKCRAGIMVTASHNPKADNGYKVYWNQGCQIVSPIDRQIEEKILANQALWPAAVATLCESSSLCKDPLPELLESYLDAIYGKISHYKARGLAVPQIPQQVVYTAMHGVGYESVKGAFAKFGLAEPIPVAEQVYPNPEFPTASFPNPEERGALRVATECAAKSSTARLIIATDPDADRCTISEKQADGTWRQFTGDQIGLIIADTLLRRWRAAHPDGDASKIAMVNSAVSSKHIRSIAAREGFMYDETLTGFKWLGSRSLALEEQGIEVLFAYEEAIGYMITTIVPDKDGVSASVFMGELAAELYTTNSSFAERLAEIEAKYGVCPTLNSYYLCYDPPTITRIFDRLRTGGAEGGYMRECGPFRVEHIRDLHTGYDTMQPDEKAVLPVSASSEMITYHFEDGCLITLRTSGTEPKVKYYCQRPPSEKTLVHSQDPAAELAHLVECFVREFLQPEQNGLQNPL